MARTLRVGALTPLGHRWLTRGCSAASLRRLGACADQVAQYGRLTRRLTPIAIRWAARHEFDMDWLAQHVLTAEPWRAYEAAMAEPRQAYNAAMAEPLICTIWEG